MANVFKLVTKTGAATSANTAQTIFTATTKTVLLGISVANLLSNTITMDIHMDSTTAAPRNNASSVYIGKGIPVPSGAALNALTGKIIMEATDVLKITSSSDNSIDVALSLMEIT